MNTKLAGYGACTIFPDSVTACALGIAFVRIGGGTCAQRNGTAGCSGKSSTIDKGMKEV